MRRPASKAATVSKPQAFDGVALLLADAAVMRGKRADVDDRRFPCDFQRVIELVAERGHLHDRGFQARNLDDEVPLQVGDRQQRDAAVELGSSKLPPRM